MLLIVAFTLEKIFPFLNSVFCHPLPQPAICNQSSQSAVTPLEVAPLWLTDRALTYVRTQVHDRSPLCSA